MSVLARRRARREERALALRLDAALSDPHAAADGLTRELKVASALHGPLAVFAEPPRTALVTLRAGLGSRPPRTLVQRRPAWFVLAATAAAAIFGGVTMAGGPGRSSPPRVAAADPALGIVSRSIKALQDALDANDPSRLQTEIVQAQETADQVINQAQAIPDQSSRQDTVQRAQDLQWLVNTAKVKLATEGTNPPSTTTSQPSSAGDHTAGTAAPPPPPPTTSTTQPEATTTTSRPPRKGTTTTEAPTTTAAPPPTTAPPTTTAGGPSTTVPRTG